MSNQNESDYQYAQMLQMMRDQGRKDNPTILEIGTMLSHNRVQLGELVLEPEDLYISDFLMVGYVYPLVTPYVYDSTFDDEGRATSRTAQAVRAIGLVAGDLVAVQRVQDTNMYVILAKVVKAR